MRRPTSLNPPDRQTWVVSLALAAVGGLACYLAYPPNDLWYLAPLACAALWAALAQVGPWRGYVSAWLFAAIWFTPMFWWAYQAAGTVPWLALSWASAALFGLMAPVWVWLRSLLSNRPWWAALGFATLIAGIDTMRSFWPFGGFPWGRLAFSQAGSPLGRWAWFAGAPWVSWCVALVGALVATTVTALWSKRRRPARAVVALMVAVVVTASPLVWPLGEGPQQGSLAVGAVQGNVAVTDDGLFAHQREVLDNHVKGTLELAEQGVDLDLVVWPENATDIDPQADQAAAEAIDQAARAVGVPILLGAMEYNREQNTRYNLSLLWTPGLGISAKYAKRHPAPFAEYMPGRSFFRLFTPKVDLIGSQMLPGKTVGLFKVPVPRFDREVAVGAVICFEVAYDSIVADTVKAGAEVLVVQTNNASFGHTSESIQQLAMSRLRAIELGRAVIQVSTVGVSAVIGPTGQITDQTGLFEAAIITADLPLRHTNTPALYLSQPVSMALMMLAAALAGLALVDRWRRRGAWSL